MRWGKIKRKLQQKPYLLDPYRVRSRRDARKMLYEQGLPCAAEVLEAARIRAGKSPEEWESLIGMSREKLARKCRAAMPVRFGHVALVSRRAVLGLGVILLLGFFLGFTHPGRALAKAVYNAVSNLIESMLYISSDADNSVVHTVPVVTENVNEEYTFNTLEELVDFVGYPIYHLAGREDALTSILLRRKTYFGERIYLTYQLDDKRVSIYQSNLKFSSFNDYYMAAGDDEVCHIELPSGIVVDGLRSRKDNSFMGTTNTGAYAITYIINNCENADDIASALDGLTLKE